MGVDSQLKRFFPLVVCTLLALAAYFQASGIGELVASSIAGRPATAPKAPQGFLVDASGANKSGKSILARNPFDSITGPLDGRIASLPPQEESAPSPDGRASQGRPGRAMSQDKSPQARMSRRFAALLPRTFTTSLRSAVKCPS